MKKIGVFDIVSSITFTKEDILENEDDYNAWIVNKALSQFADTVHIANAANKMYTLPARMQYDFLFHLVRKRKRFAKWPKADVQPDLQLIMDYYGISPTKAKQALACLSEADIDAIKLSQRTGGLTR